jgi:hypothetical protein
VGWFGAAGAGFWAWAEVIGRPPSDGTVKAAILGLGEAVLLFSSRFSPHYPFKGRSPEEVAAEAFLSKEDVRSDDHAFEDSLRG